MELSTFGAVKGMQVLPSIILLKINGTVYISIQSSQSLCSDESTVEIQPEVHAEIPTDKTKQTNQTKQKQNEQDESI